jgi:hypothetical protein
LHGIQDSGHFAPQLFHQLAGPLAGVVFLMSDGKLVLDPKVDGLFYFSAEGFCKGKVGATRRLLNLLSPASAAGDHGGGGNSKTASRPEFGTCDGISPENLVPQSYCLSAFGIS